MKREMTKAQKAQMLGLVEMLLAARGDTPEAEARDKANSSGIIDYMRSQQSEQMRRSFVPSITPEEIARLCSRAAQGHPTPYQWGPK